MEDIIFNVKLVGVLVLGDILIVLGGSHILKGET